MMEQDSKNDSVINDDGDNDDVAAFAIAMSNDNNEIAIDPLPISIPLSLQITPKEILLNEMIQKQLPNVPKNWKLTRKDMNRMLEKIKVSIFDPVKCSIWDEANFEKKKRKKGSYINFYFNTGKIALHRLLYSNFIELLQQNEYVKYLCNNKGNCCNVNHLVKRVYSGQYSRPSRNNNGQERFDIQRKECLYKL